MAKRNGLYLPDEDLKTIMRAFDQIRGEWNDISDKAAIIEDRIEKHFRDNKIIFNLRSYE